MTRLKIGKYANIIWCATAKMAMQLTANSISMQLQSL